MAPPDNVREAGMATTHNSLRVPDELREQAVRSPNGRTEQRTTW